jgi:hypothetical protein
MEYVHLQVLRKLRCSAEIINTGCIAPGLFRAREASLRSGFFCNQVVSSSFRGSFGDLGAGSIDSDTPSGHVPGGVAGARTWMSTSCGGEDLGLDCFPLSLLRVLFGKLEDLVVISLFIRVLLVNMYAPPF